MKTSLPLTDGTKIDPEMPMRLDVAARLAFPDGSINASSLRSEAKKAVSK